VEGRDLFWAVAEANLCSRLPFVPLAPSRGGQYVNKSSDSPYLIVLVLLQLVACNSSSIDVRVLRCR
jgi:hypothetical protein